MAEFHFVEDYERLVKKLIETMPMDQAMERAVGGTFEPMGIVEKNVLKYAGLRDGMSLVDLGCGSGRLAIVLGREMKIEYLGIDIIEELLEYARSKSPANYRFLLNRTLTLPCADASADMVSGFSIFTHLLHEESYTYMEEILRVLKPGAPLVFSFLEFAEPRHWGVFTTTMERHRKKLRGHLNMFIERSVLDLWASKLGFTREQFVNATDAPWGGAQLGQSVAIFRKPS
jgi:ubiquinone/menaquinone biosynthesis C-methylase UbiE